MLFCCREGTLKKFFYVALVHLNQGNHNNLEFIVCFFFFCFIEAVKIYFQSIKKLPRNPTTEGKKENVHAQQEREGILRVKQTQQLDVIFASTKTRAKIKPFSFQSIKCYGNFFLFIQLLERRLKVVTTDQRGTRKVWSDPNSQIHV